ncbi:malate/lactate/ureidoglycolate dehydrogenase [Plastoroseomonas hellenica]|uniref:malate/lactate/ureidoglycolate dehydrogenase n=1 Tax=Plastoroseomonas hellenica TaxID=2687306 RepID=UPI0020110C21|nr:malate/lactate/ureidoglycolate dehydrogenase [Plastoroseomonas hellenica]MBR0644809.1 malate/lactate/ureidoglycolate dehydrogenase [Plastoroseomonas hellenica]
MAPNDVRIPAPELEALVRSIFVAAACDEAEASRIAAHLLGANLAGHDSHGVVRVPRYVEWCEAGYVLRGQTAEVVTDGGSFAVLDGKFGFGQTVAPQAVALGIERASQNGICITALRNAGHIGRVGDYSEAAIRAGLISIHFVNVAGSVLVAPFGGVDRRFSTAPFSVGVPLPGRPLVLDFATSLVAEGKVLVASNGGKALPPNALIEPDGRLSGDPRTLYGPYESVGPRDASKGAGAIRAFGDHKGSGLAFMCEMLGGALTGGGTSGPVDQRARIANGMLSIFISPRHFGTQAEFERMGLAYAEWVAGCTPAEAGVPVKLPGEPEAATRADRLANGVPLPEAAWANIQATARRLGVTQ